VLAILSRQVPLIQFLIVFPQLDLNFLHVDGLLAVLRQINTLDLSVIGVCLLTVDDEAIIADFPLFPLGGPLLAAFPLHKNDTILEVISGVHPRQSSSGASYVFRSGYCCPPLQANRPCRNSTGSPPTICILPTEQAPPISPFPSLRARTPEFSACRLITR
jgi:hypothetical protein